MSIFRSKKCVGIAAVGLLVALGVLWFERTPLLAWYYVRQLAQAGEEDREHWVERAASLDAAVLPRLLDGLAQNDARACANFQAALARLAERWEPDDPRRSELAGALSERFPRLGPSGQQVVLHLLGGWLQTEEGRSAAPAVVEAAARVLPEAVRVLDKGVRARTLELAAVLPGRDGEANLVHVCRQLARAHLRDADPTNRVRAVRLAMQAPGDLSPQLVGLLDDPAAEVRRAAMLAVGGAQDVILTEDLLRWLHDPDAEVRQLCEAALRGRGLSPAAVRLGRLLTDQNPTVRLQVVESLRDDTDLDPSAWLRLLSHDLAPAVRAAAVRAAVEFGQVDLTDRIEQISRSDPSPTVCQLARYYLAFPKHQSTQSIE